MRFKTQTIQIKSTILLFFIYFLTSWNSALAMECQTEHGHGQKIVSIGGSITEIIYSLGCGENIVAVDSTSLYPTSALQAHANIGYMRTIAAEPILAMQPDLVIADNEAEPEQQLKLIANSGIQLEKISGDHGIDAMLGRIREIAVLLSVDARGKELINTIESQLETFNQKVSQAASNRRVLFLLSVDAGPIMAAGKDTAANTMIELAGGTNVFTSFNGYKPVTTEAILQAAPELILLPNHIIKSEQAVQQLIERPEFKMTPAAQNNNVEIIDSLYILGFGPRTPDALNDLYSLMKE